MSTHPLTYWWLGAALWLALLIAAARASQRSSRFVRWWDEAVFAGLSVAAFITVRWPILFDSETLNPDEAQMAAQAIKALSDPLPWHGFDGTTSGPVNSYALTIPRLLGFPITLPATHVMAAALELGTVFVVQAAIARMFGRTVGRAAALVLLAFYTFEQDPNFVHYSSEHVPIFLIACGLLAFANVYRSGSAALVSCALGGVALGLAPLAKLQSLLLVVYIGAGMLIAIATGSTPATITRKRCMWFVAGGLGCVALFAGLCALDGSLHDALVSYIMANAAYSQNVTTLGPRFFIAPDPTYFIFGLAAISLFTLLAAVALWSPPDRSRTGIVAFAGGLMVVGIWTVRLANHGFPHYLVFTIVPSVVLLAALAGTVYRALGRTLRARYSMFGAVGMLVVLPLLLQQLVAGNGLAYEAPAYFGYHDRMAAALRRVVPSGVRVAVWGWMPQFYVDTQTIMATKDAHTYAEIVPGRFRGYFRARYLQSIDERPPAYIIDAVAPGSFGFADRAAAGVETFPQLAAVIARDYRLVADLGGVRVYRRSGS